MNSRRAVVPILAVHGGAGPRALTAAQRDCLTEALSRGHAHLRHRGPALDAVEIAIRVMEESGLFNAGLGSRVQLDGVRRMDAALMRGRDLKAGAVASIEGIRHPITAARLVMEHTAHVLLAGPPASRFARRFGLTPAPRRPKRLPRVRELETVGAVALDLRGGLAAGTSTGGVSNMLPGRVGDSPLIGSGLYADDQSVAVSMTGIGESIIRIGIAKEIADRIEAGATAASATRAVLHRLMQRISGSAGALVLDRRGHVIIRHTTSRMPAGYLVGTGRPVIGDRFTR